MKTIMDRDCFTNFLEAFEKGHVLSALQQILTGPEAAYDDLYSQDKEALHIVADYVDATVLTNCFSSEICNVRLQNLLNTRQLACRFPNTLTMLKFEESMLHTLNFSLTEHSPEEAFIKYHQQLLQAPDLFLECTQQRTKVMREWIKFKKCKPSLANLIQHPHVLYSSPWHIFRYSNSTKPLVLTKHEGIPLIFLDPCDRDYSELLNPLKEKPAVFVFDTKAAFFHLLQFEEVAISLSDPEHLIYILEFYPNELLKAQEWRCKPELSLQPLLFDTHSAAQEALPLFVQALRQCLNQSPEELIKDNALANWLYRISQGIASSIEEKRLGITRSVALAETKASHHWYDPHKGLPPSNLPQYSKKCDYLSQKLSEIGRGRYARIKIIEKKMKLAHIVPQIVDASHAPSRLLRTLLTHSNREQFELFLISTERLTFHPNDYPINSTFTPHSIKTAKETLRQLQNLGIPFYLIPEGFPYEETAKAVASLLHELKIDIAVFHGPDTINCLIAQMCDVPLRVLFEHGTLPTYPCFDRIIVSTEAALEIYANEFKMMGMDAYALPYAIDLQSDWSDPAPTKKDLGLPENSIVLTTISLHLEERLGTEMCHAIAGILKRCPNAYYVPIGPISEQNKRRFLNYFQAAGIDNRVLFLGSKTNPSHWVRAMDLYLNEFPFGSGLGILDAIASGKPVITMYDKEGPPQSRYGGSYFGIDKSIRSGRVEDYVNLACELIKNKLLYKEWSLHALERYKMHTNTEAYVKGFENIVSRH